jgi:hypothetical protein
LWEGLRVERRVAVARPIPEDPPVMMTVFGVDLRMCSAEIEGEKRAMVGVVVLGLVIGRGRMSGRTLGVRGDLERDG